MLEWIGQTKMYGLLFIILPILYLLRKLFKMGKQKMLKAKESKIRNSNKRVDTINAINVDVGEVRSAVDLINFQLILIESKIYKDIEPVPPLSVDEFSDAVRHLDYIKTTTLPFAIGQIMKE